MGWPSEPFLNLRQILKPKGRPAVGGNLLYVKADNNLYLLDSDGTEHAVGGTGSTGTARQVLVYSGGAYPSRPVGGYCEYVGPTQPTTWVSGDTWILA